MIEKLLSYSEINERTGISKGTLAWWVRERKIPHVRLGPRHVKFRWSDVSSWLDSKTLPPLEPIANRGRR